MKLKRVAEYVDSGFLFLQHVIDLAIIKTLQPSANINETKLQLKPFPRPPYIQDELSKSVKGHIALFVWLMFLLYTFDIATNLVADRQSTMEVWWSTSRYVYLQYIIIIPLY